MFSWLKRKPCRYGSMVVKKYGKPGDNVPMYEITVFLKETERRGPLSKVKVLSTSSGRDISQIKKCCEPWVRTDMIQWD